MFDAIPEKQLRVAVYLRVSTDEQVEKYGLSLQEEAIRAYVASRPRLLDGRPSMEITQVYRDEGISGTTSSDERPGFSSIKEALYFSSAENRPFDIVAVYRIDRFARKLKILMEIMEFLDKQNIQLLSATESIDTSTPFGRAILGIIGVIAELEVETFKERSMKGKKEARNEGVYMGPHAPYGYNKDDNGRLVIFETEAEVIRKVFFLYTVQGYSVIEIAKYLKDHEIITPEVSAIMNGKRKGEIQKKSSETFWRDLGVRSILNDELYIGNYYANKTKGTKKLPKSEWVLIDYKYPAIVPTETFALAQKKLEETKYMYRKAVEGTDTHTYILSGLMRCTCCYDIERDGLIMHTFIGDRKKLNSGGVAYYYKCGRKNTSKSSIVCNCLPIPADEIEQFALNFIKRLISNPRAVHNYQTRLQSERQEYKRLMKELDGVKKLLNALPDQRKNILSQHEKGYIKNEELEEKMKGLITKESHYKEKIEELDRKAGNSVLSAEYEEVFHEVATKYRSVLNTEMADRKLASEICRMLIGDVVVYGRPVTKNDLIAGRKKESQQIPDRIHINLKLPQEIINNLTREFGANYAEWWAGRDSNPRPWP